MHTHYNHPQQKLTAGCLNQLFEDTPKLPTHPEYIYAHTSPPYTHTHTHAHMYLRHSTAVWSFPWWAALFQPAQYRLPSTAESDSWYRPQCCPANNKTVEEMLIKIHEWRSAGYQHLFQKCNVPPDNNISPCTQQAQYAVIRITTTIDLHSVGWWLLW